MIILTGVIIFILMVMFILDLKKKIFNTREMIIIAMFSAISTVLSMIQFVKYPQGGGITLLYMLPLMLLSILYGKTAGVTGGLIVGILFLLKGGFVVHPIQFFLDYLLATMALGLAGIFGSEKKYKIILGCLLAVFLSVFCNFLSGVLFFSQYAPEGMNSILYSFIYNFSSAGVEGLITVLVIGVLPIKTFQKAANLNSVEM
ncbi:energy-coupled thiamine transporter ThiT [Clostridium sp.]|uniref:energy-coupled thiamine transporter ThiT n=1 Tax=Clostridium sp. TaxID=1506 RepID=UPI003F366DE4